MDPALFIGGYDASNTPENENIIDTSTNPPDLSKAPEAPYLRDLARDNVVKRGRNSLVIPDIHRLADMVEEVRGD